MVTTDDFTNAHVLFERALPALAHSLTFQPGDGMLSAHSTLRICMCMCRDIADPT